MIDNRECDILYVLPRWVYHEIEWGSSPYVMVEGAGDDCVTVAFAPEAEKEIWRQLQEFYNEAAKQGKSLGAGFISEEEYHKVSNSIDKHHDGVICSSGKEER